MPPVIELEAVHKRFGPVRALTGIDMSVDEGETVGVMGPNGSGKSTLLKLITGMVRADSGTVTVDGQDPRTVKAKMGYVGHDPYLYPYLTTFENLRFYCTLYGVDASRADTLIAMLDLTHKRERLISTMSRGQVQRASIARALLHDPDVLILDEPFSGLDAQATASLRQLLAERRRTTVMVTHDERSAEQICDRIVTLDGGRIQPGTHLE